MGASSGRPWGFIRLAAIAASRALRSIENIAARRKILERVVSEQDSVNKHRAMLSSAFAGHMQARHDSMTDSEHGVRVILFDTPSVIREIARYQMPNISAAADHADPPASRPSPAARKARRKRTSGSVEPFDSESPAETREQADPVPKATTCLREGTSRTRVATPNHRKAHSAPQTLPVRRPLLDERRADAPRS